MAESFRTEEEQVEALKKWWDENGRSTVIAVVLALAASFGWQGFQQYQTDQAESASVIYEDLLDALSRGEGISLTETQRRNVQHLAGQLKTDYSGSSYSGYAGLLLAGVAVEDGELELAEEELRWVLANAANGEIGELAEIRLARVLAAKGDSEQALKILDDIDQPMFRSSVARARGDIYLATDRKDQAVAAYQEALVVEGESPGGGSGGLLKMQLDHLSPVPPREASAPAVAEATENEVVEDSPADDEEQPEDEQ